MSTPDCSDVCEIIHMRLLRLGFEISGDEDHTDMIEALDRVELIRNEENKIDITKEEAANMFGLSYDEFVEKYLALDEESKLGVITFSYGFIHSAYKSLGYLDNI